MTGRVIGVISDTHKDENNATPHIIEEFRRRGVNMVFHPGDLDRAHFLPQLYGGFDLYYALTEDQCEREADGRCRCPKDGFFPPAANWRYTIPGHRIVRINEELYYLGHKLPFDFFLNVTEKDFDERLHRIRLANDGLRWIFGGHTHFQTYRQGRLASLINPGAACGAINWGYEFAVLYEDKGEVVFGRIMPTPPQGEPFTVGVISDSLNVSRLDTSFWGKLRNEFFSRGVSHVIHCGNIAIEDIGRPELGEFIVHFNLLPEQVKDLNVGDMDWQKKLPENWILIDPEKPVVDISGQRFYVKLDLALDLAGLSEMGMDFLAMKIRKDFPMTNYVLCGFTNDALYHEGQQIRIINPGDVNHDRNFCTICFPRHEITFGHVPIDPLPAI
ncbi:MAG: Calcineurin-like phosphoesterase superfamily domain protein [Parcubacteria group bacterium ADurb.Bin326]|nr:MAG: Calcineurin-like phosphoesterase superfamily domain protein [Parcubacteria group bacterium ADurb.Bin326]